MDERHKNALRRAVQADERWASIGEGPTEFHLVVRRQRGETRVRQPMRHRASGAAGARAAASAAGAGAATWGAVKERGTNRQVAASEVRVPRSRARDRTLMSRPR